MFSPSRDFCCFAVSIDDKGVLGVPGVDEWAFGQANIQQPHDVLCWCGECGAVHQCNVLHDTKSLPSFVTTSLSTDGGITCMNITLPPV